MKKTLSILLAISAFCFSTTTQAHQEYTFGDATTMFTSGYLAGVIPLLGQVAFIIMLDREDGRPNAQLLHRIPLLAGHALGLATLLYAAKSFANSANN